MPTFKTEALCLVCTIQPVKRLLTLKSVSATIVAYAIYPPELATTTIVAQTTCNQTNSHSFNPERPRI